MYNLYTAEKKNKFIQEKLKIEEKEKLFKESKKSKIIL